VQKTLARVGLWYSPANSKVKLDDKYNDPTSDHAGRKSQN